MNITCPHCQTKLNIPDEKVPKDRDSSFKCPKCHEKVKVSAPGAKSGPAGQNVSSRSFSSPGIRRAMICLGSTAQAEPVMSAVKHMGFDVQTPQTISQALRSLEYHVFPLVIADESFDQGKGLSDLILHMNDLDMSLRRRICLILMSREISTGDHMAAMHASVNYVVGADGLAHLPDLLSAALTEHENFYIVYNESLKATGKA